jgi:DNA-binding LacI/PurR family transcriptional regulator
MAIGSMQALREANLRVPQEISIVGYDDLPISEHLNPPLTTVRQPRRELGTSSVKLVMELIEKGDKPKPKVHLLKPYLIRRKSVLDYAKDFTAREEEVIYQHK